MNQKFVEYHGRMVIEGWPEKIQAAQQQKTCTIGGVKHLRIPYGEEPNQPPEEQYASSCGDCAVQKGQLHVPNCDTERCPVCGGQFIFCACRFKPVNKLRIR